MSISGLILHSKPTQMSRVEAALSKLPGLEIHARTDDGTFIITIDEESDSGAADTVMHLSSIEGVLSTSLAYHNFESELGEME